MADPAENVRLLIEPVAEALGFEIVRVTYGGSGRMTLQVMAERPDGSMSVDDCAILSREISALLDVEDPIGGQYVLEVSSPGIDRPLMRPKDYSRYAGHEAKVELKAPIGGQRRLRGVIKQANDSEFVLQTESDDIAIRYDDVLKAKLIMTDALVEAYSKAQAKNEKDPSGQ